MTIGQLSFGPSSLPALSMADSSSTGSRADASGLGSDFSSVLTEFAGSTIQALRQGEAAAIGGVQGAVPIQNVAESILAAERSLQVAIAVRDKFVSAYLEISRMQV
jgi:flagellar hook-basal body complex protein FliE